MTTSEAVALVATLAAAWPRQPIEQATLDIYAHDLADLDFGLAARAVESVRRSATYFPAIAEIRNAAAELRLDAPSPMLAWEQASGRSDRHPLVREAREIVGDDWAWRQEPAGVLRKAFLAAYTEVRAAAVTELVQGALTAGLREIAA